jgi:PIN like domain
LNRTRIRFERHLSHFSRGTPDEIWLPLVGKNRWILLTADKRIRYSFLEKRALQRNGVREFVFASGNLSGQDMAAALERALPKMQRLCHRYATPFVAAITRTGEVHLRWPNPKTQK